jgi:hypothetical protein
MAQPQDPLTAREKVARAEDSITAAERVLLLPELLEDILFYLPTHTIYGVRRVCQTWNGIIEQGVALKPKMFKPKMFKPKMFLSQRPGGSHEFLSPFPKPAAFHISDLICGATSAGWAWRDLGRERERPIHQHIEDPETPIINPILEELVEIVRESCRWPYALKPLGARYSYLPSHVSKPSSYTAVMAPVFATNCALNAKGRRRWAISSGQMEEIARNAVSAGETWRGGPR